MIVTTIVAAFGEETILLNGNDEPFLRSVRDLVHRQDGETHLTCPRGHDATHVFITNLGQRIPQIVCRRVAIFVTMDVELKASCEFLNTFRAACMPLLAPLTSGPR